MELEPAADEDHLWVDLEEEKMVIPKVEAKKTLVKMAPKIVDEEAKGDEKSLSSSEFDDVFNINYTVPSRRTHKTKRFQR